MAAKHVICISLVVLTFMGLSSCQDRDFTGTDNYVDVGIDLSSRQCVIFQLASCGPNINASYASVGLTARKDDYTSDYYEVVINGPPDSNGAITYIVKNGVEYPKAVFMKFQETFGVNCTEEQFFWITWKDGSITLGHGDSTTSGSVLVYHDEFPISINFMGVSNYNNSAQSSWTIPAEFYTANSPSCVFSQPIDSTLEVCDQPDQDFTFDSGDYHHYKYAGMNLRLRNWIVFQAKATSDVSVELVTNYYNGDGGDYPSWEFNYQNRLYWSNFDQSFSNNIYIDDDLTTLAHVTNTTLDPDNFKTFWVSWDTGKATSGTGNQVGLNPYMTYEISGASPDHTIWDTLITSASETPAVLRFSGCYFPYDKNFSSDGDAVDVEVELSKRKCVLFQLKSCTPDNTPGTASVYLSARMNDFTGDYYNIVINGPRDSNGATTYIIKNGSTAASLIDGEGLELSCTKFNWFWISLRSGGSLTLGVGNTIGANAVLTYSDDNAISIFYMAVSSFDASSDSVATMGVPAVLYSQNRSYCNLPDYINGTAEECSEEDRDFTFDSTTFKSVSTGMDISNRNWIVFQAQAKSDVYVTLLSGDHQYSLRYNEIKNGEPHDTIYKNGNIVSTATSSQYTLDPGQFYWFWISWGNGEVMSGVGSFVGNYVMLSFHDDSPESTSSISLVDVACLSETPCTIRFSGCYFPPESCLPQISRTEWNSKSTSPSAALLQLPVKKVIVHVTMSVSSFYTTADCTKEVKAIERNQQAKSLTAQYMTVWNYLICEDGRVYEGAGKYVGNHTKGQSSDSIGIAFIGKFKDRLPNARAMEAFRGLLSSSCATNLGLDPDFKIAPHYNLDCTLCPNHYLRDWILQQYSDKSFSANFPCRRGSYVHPVKK